MSESIAEQIEKLRTALATLETQRAILGDAIEPAIAATRQQIEALEAQRAAASPVEERRLITILFTDVVGSTSLAEKLDPEEWRQTVARLHETVGNIVAQYHGSVAQYLGDGLLAFFGAQTASEYDAENAIRAALEFQSAVGAFHETLLHQTTIQLRVGIHTGLVVVGELGADSHKEFTATGDAMNLAARLQSAATPGGILISHDTYRYVRGVFDVTPQPPIAVKGKSEPIQTYLVRRAKPRPFRTVVRGVAGVETRTVGRTRESKQLQDAYLDAYENKRVVWAQLIAEPGMGKSRLLQDTREWIELRPETVRLLRARAYPEDMRQPFALVRRMWFDRFQIAEDAPLAQAEAKWVQQFNTFLGRADEEAAHALGLLVGLPFENSPHIGAMRHDPAQVKGRAFVVSRELLAAMRAETPLELLLEDLHVADAASVEYFVEVVWKAETNDALNGIFVLATARPEWSLPETLTDNPQQTLQDLAASSPATRHSIVIRLSPLTDDAARELVGELLQKVTGVREEVVQMIVERSEGVPFFAEEMVNYFVDRSIIDKSVDPWRFVEGRLRESPLPTTLQHLLLTRLSALSDAERATLQRGAIFGRNFWTGGVQALGARASEELLPRLEPRGFVVAQPDSSFDGEQEWSFYHNLLRDVTYESVLKRERAHLHKKAAEWLEQQAGAADRLDEFAGLLGEHLEKAGELKAAAEWFVRAGERAWAQGAPSEAKHFFDRALELLPPVEHELRWRALLGRQDALDRLGERDAQVQGLQALLELAELADDDERRAQALFRQGRLLMRTGDIRAQLELAAQAQQAARRAGNLALEAGVLGRRIASYTRLGEMDAARALVENALALARDARDNTALASTLGNIALHYGEAGDVGRSALLNIESADAARRAGDRSLEGYALVRLGFNYAVLGLYRLARPTTEQALRLAEAVGDRRPRAYCLQNLGWVYLRSGDGRTARRLEEDALRELTAVGDAYGRAASLTYLGYIDEQAQDYVGAARRFAEARQEYERIGVRGSAEDGIAGIARCALMQGQLDVAREHANEVWTYLSGHGIEGIEQPTLCYLTCADIFDALGAVDESRAAVEQGYQELMTRAEKISDAEWRKSFLENVPEHRTMIEMWERIS